MHAFMYICMCMCIYILIKIGVCSIQQCLRDKMSFGYPCGEWNDLLRDLLFLDLNLLSKVFLFMTKIPWPFYNSKHPQLLMLLKHIHSRMHKAIIESIVNITKPS